MYRYKQRLSRLFFAGLGVLLIGGVIPALAASAPASHQSSGSDMISNSITQSYSADKSVQPGMIVQLKPSDPKSVEPLPGNQLKGLLGVVVPSTNATIVLSPQTVTQQQVLVATSSRQQTLVSNQNGPIKVGDYISISAVSGIGMKAAESQTLVIGKAASDFSGTGNVISTLKLKSASGKDQSLAVGRIAVDLNVAHNPLFLKTVDFVPGFIAKAALTIANKPVSAARIYLSSALLVLTAILTGNMLYSGVRNGMKAIGRNPLSKKSIVKSLIQTVLAGLIIFVAGVFAVYLLLKL